MALALTIAEQIIQNNLRDITNLQTQAKILFTRIQTELTNGTASTRIVNGVTNTIPSATAEEIQAAWTATGRLAELQNVTAILQPLIG